MSNPVIQGAAVDISNPAETAAELANILERLESKIDLLRSVKSAGSLPPIASHDICQISFISPCFNEEENLQCLHERITRSCQNAGITDYEILWIENGSVDGSLALMRHIKESDPHLRVIQFSRNFGYQGAISCGLLHARGEWIGILDADLQDPPELLIDMLGRANTENYDIVYGQRKSRKEGIFKRNAYLLFYRLWRMTADITVPLDAGDFGIMHRRVAHIINSMPERQRFVRGLRAWVGFRQLAFPYDRLGRHAGETKFKLRGMIALALDGLISYSVLPLRGTLLFGLMLVAATLLLSLIQGVFRILAYMHLVGISGILPPGLTQLSLILTALLGLNLICLGVVGEYVGRIYNETKDRPLFVIRRILE